MVCIMSGSGHDFDGCSFRIFWNNKYIKYFRIFWNILAAVFWSCHCSLGLTWNGIHYVWFRSWFWWFLSLLDQSRGDSPAHFNLWYFIILLYFILLYFIILFFVSKQKCTLWTASSTHDPTMPNIAQGGCVILYT